MVTITQIAFAIRAETQSTSTPIKNLGHAQQLVAAALGYKSYAAYQASTLELSALDYTAHIVLDAENLAERTHELKLPIPASALTIAVTQSFKKCLPNIHLHDSIDSLDNYIRTLVDTTVVNDEAVSAEMAMTNGDGVDEIYMSVDDFDFDLLPPDEPIDQEISGHVSMDIDTERPYSGHKIHVQATLTLERTGKCSIAQPVCTVTRASLDYGWSDDDEYEDQGPTISLAQALAEELDIELDEAEELVDSDYSTNESNDGLVYSYFFDFSRDASPELAKKLKDKHGSLSIEVPAWFFDRVTTNPYE